MFLWKALSEALPVVDFITKRGMKIDSRCQICGGEGESVNHVLFSCTLARHVWALSNFHSPQFGFDDATLFSNFYFLLKSAKNMLVHLEIGKIFSWVVWFIWNNRNGLLFDGRVFLAPEVVTKARDECEQWFDALDIDSREEDLLIAKRVLLKKNGCGLPFLG